MYKSLVHDNFPLYHICSLVGVMPAISLEIDGSFRVDDAEAFVFSRLEVHDGSFEVFGGC